MERIRNIALTLVVTLLGFSALAYNLAGLLLPTVFEMPEYSDLEARYYTAFPEISADSIADGSFQNAFDSYLSDHIPGRDSAVFLNAGLQRASIAASAAVFGFDVYPTFFDSHYYVAPQDRLIVDRAEEQPKADDRNLDAWVDTLNAAARNHTDTRFVYDCVARHDQTEANPTYRYFRNRINPEWAQENILDKLDPRIASFVDSVASYDEIKTEWIATEEHWTLRRALKSYNMIADKLALKHYAYESPVEVVSSWYGDYARNGLDLDIPVNLEDSPVDFSSLSFYELGEVGKTEKFMGVRESVLAGETTIQPGGVAKYYEYFGGGCAEAINNGEHNGKTALFVGDSLSYCLARYIASNYRHTVFLLPGNSRLDGSLESYIEQYDPDDVIIMAHITKYAMFAEYSPAFIGL